MRLRPRVFSERLDRVAARLKPEPVVLLFEADEETGFGSCWKRLHGSSIHPNQHGSGVETGRKK